MTIVLAIIAMLGAFIAFQQMMIARVKLNHDLFDKRFAVYSATRAYMAEMLRNRGGVQEDAVKWHAVASAAPFLFENEVSDFLKELSKKGSMTRARVGDKPIYESAEVAKYNESIMWISTNFDKLEVLFKDSMSLSRLSLFSPVTLSPLLRNLRLYKRPS